tara:strand:- start:741 stop:1112 length:372 start_codon:yes stop_codon:yes gene_type:complete
MSDTPKGKKCLKVKCLLSGVESVMSGDRLTKKIEEFGSVEEVETTYVHRRAIRLLKKGYSVENIRKLLKVDDQALPIIDEDKYDRIYNLYCKRTMLNHTNIPDLSTLIYEKSDPKVVEFIAKI